MATVPKKYVKEGRTWLKYFTDQDCHKWIIALEHGRNGLVHWQLRWQQRQLDTKESRDRFFQTFKTMFPQAHIELSERWCDYERKEGWFVCSEDTKDTIKVRFAPMWKNQRAILSEVDNQTDREIDVFYDPRGNHGKSFLSIHLFERGEAFLVLAKSSAQASADICSGYKGERYIILDIPRSQKIPSDLYETLERIKDGIVHDSRWQNRTRNIRGAKLIVFTNQKLDTRKLSADRWRLHGILEGECP